MLLGMWVFNSWTMDGIHYALQWKRSLNRWTARDVRLQLVLSWNHSNSQHVTHTSASDSIVLLFNVLLWGRRWISCPCMFPQRLDTPGRRFTLEIISAIWRLVAKHQLLLAFFLAEVRSLSQTSPSVWSTFKWSTLSFPFSSFTSGPLLRAGIWWSGCGCCVDGERLWKWEIWVP